MSKNTYKDLQKGRVSDAPILFKQKLPSNKNQFLNFRVEIVCRNSLWVQYFDDFPIIFFEITFSPTFVIVLIEDRQHDDLIFNFDIHYLWLIEELCFICVIDQINGLEKLLNESWFGDCLEISREKTSNVSNNVFCLLLSTAMYKPCP